MSEITHEISLDRFHTQISWVLEHYTQHGLKAGQFRNVIIGGLGGSGIGGRIAKLAMYTAFPLPIEVYSEYQLPAYAGPESLVILSSYSGNTEETLSMYDDARKKGCHIICLSSGGKISSQAATHGYPCYAVETGFQPRMALGYSLTTLLLIFGELSGINMAGPLMEVAELLKSNDAMKSHANSITNHFKDHLSYKFVIICDTAYEGAAIRCCQQIQENAKGEAFVAVLPEANHNVIESYYSRHDTNFILLNSGLNSRNNARFEYLKTVLDNTGNRYYQMPHMPFGLSSLFYTIHTLDWVSIYLSDLKGENNMRVDNIAQLKTYLDTVPH